MLSIIIPVYNSSQYLDQCVESILNQSYKDLEIVFVDDGSSDDSYLKLKSWEDRDFRIKVYHKDNGGVSSARNYGLDVISGEFVTFVDSDDMLSVDMYRCMMDVFDENTDIVCCGINTFSSDGCLKSTRTVKNLLILDPNSAMREMLLGNAVYMTVYNKIFRSELFNSDINKIRFPEGKLMEEADVLPKIMLNCKIIKQVPFAKYNYYKREMSLTTRPISNDVYFIFNMIRDYETNVVPMYNNLLPALITFKYRNVLYLYRSAILQKRYIDLKIYRDLKRKFLTCLPRALISSLLSLREKILYIDTFLHLPMLYKAPKR